MTRAQARTRDIYAANVEKSRATRDPITFQLHDASGALKKGGVAVEESGWDRPAPGARDGNDRAFPLPETAALVLENMSRGSLQFLDDERVVKFFLQTREHQWRGSAARTMPVACLLLGK